MTVVEGPAVGRFVSVFLCAVIGCRVVEDRMSGCSHLLMTYQCQFEGMQKGMSKVPWRVRSLGSYRLVFQHSFGL